jgi:hypothetical protein
MYNYKDIKNNVKNSQKLVYWFNEHDLLIVGQNKIQTKEYIKKLSYNGLLYRFNISFHTGNKIDQGGVIALNIQLYNKIGNTLEKITNNKKNGIIWFDKYTLEVSGWRENKIISIYNIIKQPSFKFSFGITTVKKLI